MTKAATFQIDRAAIMQAAWWTARECAAESAQFAHIEGQPRAAHTFLSYALRLAWAKARKAARFAAAPEALRNRLAEIDAAPRERMGRFGPTAREVERRAIITQIFGA